MLLEDLNLSLIEIEKKYLEEDEFEEFFNERNDIGEFCLFVRNGIVVKNNVSDNILNVWKELIVRICEEYDNAIIAEEEYYKEENL